MRDKLTTEKLKDFMRQFARRSKGPGAVYFTGGTTALLLGIREQTIDIDLKLDPEPSGAFEAIAELKNELNINIELASPGDFIPTPSSWKDNSLHIDTINQIQFFHYDLVMQALSKLERGHDQDILDVQALLDNSHISAQQIQERFAEIADDIIRFPSINRDLFHKKVSDFLKKKENHE